MSAYNWEHVKLAGICKGRQHFVAEDGTLRVHHVEEGLEDLEVERRREHFPPERNRPKTFSTNSRIDNILLQPVLTLCATWLLCWLEDLCQFKIEYFLIQNYMRTPVSI